MLQPFLIVIGVFLLIFYLVGAINSGNWLWLLPFQPTYEPSLIEIRSDGVKTQYRPGDEGYDTLTEALNASLADFANADLVPTGLSDETLAEYDRSGVVLNVYYPQAIRFNTPVRMNEVNQLLIPFEGRQAGNRYVFLGVNGNWLAGAMVMRDDQALQEALRDLGYVSQ